MRPYVFFLSAPPSITWVSGFLCLIVMSCQLARAEGSESDFTSQIQANEEKISRLNAEVSEAQRERKKLLSRLQDTDGLIEGRAQRIKALRKDIRQYEQRVDVLESRLQQSQGRIRQAQDTLGQLMLTSLQLRSNDGLQVMLQHTDPALSSRVGVYYDYYLRATATRIKSETQLLSSTRDAQLEASKSRNWLQYLKKKAASQQQDYTGKKQDSTQRLTHIEASLKEKKQQVTSLKKDQERLAGLLEELRKQSLGASGFFAKGQGKYPWPTQGKRHARFGEVKSVGKVKWTGMFIDAKRGAPVRTIADGEVVYADWLQGFGMLVIIDHGDGYMTLYGGNRDLQVKKADWVEFGARIATVGDSGGQNRNGLYFEVRLNAKPIDPELWVGAKNRFETTAIRADN